MTSPNDSSPPALPPPPPPSSVQGPESRLTSRAFARGFIAARYLLGRRQDALSGGAVLATPGQLRELKHVAARLSRGIREERARALATEVSHLIRSLHSQRLK